MRNNSFSMQALHSPWTVGPAAYSERLGMDAGPPICHLGFVSPTPDMTVPEASQSQTHKQQPGRGPNLSVKPRTPAGYWWAFCYGNEPYQPARANAEQVKTRRSVIVLQTLRIQ